MDVGRELNPLTAIARILLAQIGLGLLVAAAGYGLAGGVAAYSALLGSLACVLPNTFLGARIVLGGADGNARSLVRASYAGAAGKLLLTAAFFAVVFVSVRPLGPAWFFAGFLLSQAVIWVSPFLTREPQTLTGDEVPGPSTMG